MIRCWNDILVSDRSVDEIANEYGLPQTTVEAVRNGEMSLAGFILEWDTYTSLQEIAS
jgi:hypothetical protein